MSGGKVIELPNSFEGVESYLINSQAGDDRCDFSIDYWFHDDLDEADYAYRLYFSRFRYLQVELDYFQSTSLWSRLDDINTIETSNTPFKTMRIELQHEDGTPKVELKNVKYHRLFLHGLAYVEVAADDFTFQKVDVEELWSVRHS